MIWILGELFFFVCLVGFFTTHVGPESKCKAGLLTKCSLQIN